MYDLRQSPMAWLRENEYVSVIKLKSEDYPTPILHAQVLLISQQFTIQANYKLSISHTCKLAIKTLFCEYWNKHRTIVLRWHLW